MTASPLSAATASLLVCLNLVAHPVGIVSTRTSRKEPTKPKRKEENRKQKGGESNTRSSLQWTPPTQTSGVSNMYGTPTTFSWALLAHGRKQKRSRSNLLSSCEMNSSWNSPRQKRS